MCRRRLRSGQAAAHLVALPPHRAAMARRFPDCLLVGNKRSSASARVHREEHEQNVHTTSPVRDYFFHFIVTKYYVILLLI